MKHKIGNLLECNEKLVAHGCNIQGKFASGVAKHIREKWPKAYDAYMAVHKSEGIQLGDCIVVDVEDKVIVNIATQEFYGYDGKRYVDYDAIKRGFESVRDICMDKDIKEIAIPRIGSGLGGGNWKEIEPIIDDSLYPIVAVCYSLEENID